MIILYSGTPGSGKSLHAASVLLNRVNRKKPLLCITNFDVDRTKIKHNDSLITLDNFTMTSQRLIEISNIYFSDRKRKEGEILLFIDEAQLLFNSRNFTARDRMDWLSFFSQHRKYGYDVVLMAQFDRMIDRQIRSLIEYEFIHRKVGNFGKFGKFLSIFFGGALFCSIKMWYPLKQKVGHEFFTAKKKYYEIYDTFATFKKTA